MLSGEQVIKMLIRGEFKINACAFGGFNFLRLRTVFCDVDNSLPIILFCLMAIALKYFLSCESGRRSDHLFKSWNKTCFLFWPVELRFLCESSAVLMTGISRAEPGICASSANFRYIRDVGLTDLLYRFPGFGLAPFLRFHDYHHPAALRRF